MTGESLKPLPIHVEPYSGESLLSLIVRAAEANVYPRTSQLLALAEITTLRPEFVPFTKQQHVEAIAQRLGLPVGEIALRMHSPAPSVPMPDWVDWFGTPIPRDFIDAETFRYSAASLKQTAFHRATWMLKPLKFCYESMEYLVTTCAHCGRKLGWKYGRQPDVCEKCKSPLVDVDTTSVPSRLQSGAKAAASLVNPDKNVRTTALNQLPAVFADWHAGEVFAAIVELGAFTSPPLPTSELNLTARSGRGDFSIYTTEHLVRGYEFLHRWPSSLGDFLSAITTKGPLRRKYLQGAGPPNRLRELIRTSFLEQARELQSPLCASRGYRASWSRADGLIAQKDAVAEFHIRKEALSRLQNGGRCMPPQGCRQGTKAYVRELLGNSILILRSSVSVHRCARAIGIPAYCVSALADQGFLKAVEDHDACLIAKRPIYEQGSLDKLLEALSKVPVSTEKRGVNVSVNNLMRGRFHPKDWADLIKALVHGTLRTTHKTGKSIDSYFVDENAATRFCQQLPKRELPDNVSVPVITAARLLCINQNAVRMAITAGVIFGQRTSRRNEIALRDIGEFYAKYFVSPEARFRYGLEGRILGRRMTEAGFAAVCTIYKLTVWRRDDVESVFKPNLLMPRKKETAGPLARHFGHCKSLRIRMHVGRPESA